MPVWRLHVLAVVGWDLGMCSTALVITRSTALTGMDDHKLGGGVAGGTLQSPVGPFNIVPRTPYLFTSGYSYYYYKTGSGPRLTALSLAPRARAKLGS